MWARVVEFMLACWLAMSPFIFQHPVEISILWRSDFICAALIALFALLSYVRALEKMHLLTLGIALWLIDLGYSSVAPATSPALQNEIILGMILGMVALVPSHSELPPRPWRLFYKKKHAQK